MFEHTHGRKLTDAEAVAMVKSFPITTAKVGNGKDEAIFTEWAFQSAGQIVSKLGSDDEIVEIILKLESMYRSKSCLNHMSKLEKLAVKPLSKDGRRWVTQNLFDRIYHGLLDNDAVTKAVLCGDKHQCGLISLLEWKKRLLGYVCDQLMVSARLADADRMAIKHRMYDCFAMRSATEGDLTWQAQLMPSGQEALKFVQDVVYFKSFDNVLLQVVKSATSNVELIDDVESIKDARLKALERTIPPTTAAKLPPLFFCGRTCSALKQKQ